MGKGMIVKVSSKAKEAYMCEENPFGTYNIYAFGRREAVATEILKGDLTFVIDQNEKGTWCNKCKNSGLIADGATLIDCDCEKDIVDNDWCAEHGDDFCPCKRDDEDYDNYKQEL